MSDFDIYTNRVPWGLLNDEEQAALKAHHGKVEYYSPPKWRHIDEPGWYDDATYRAVRKPVETVTDRPMWLSENDDLYYMIVTGIPITVRITRRDGKFVRGEVLPRETEGEE